MTDDKETKMLIEKTSKLVTKTLDDVFKSKTFKCSMYLLKYIYDKDEEYFDKFIAMFRTFSPQEKMQVMCNVRANLKEQGKLKGKENENKNKIIEQTDKTLIRELGIPYDIFEQLDFDEQQKIIQQHRQQKKKECNGDTVTVMVGSGEDAIFVEKKRGERYMLSDGTFVIAGDTPEESKARLEDRLDDAVYSKPVAFVKKMVRRIKNR